MIHARTRLCSFCEHNRIMSHRTYRSSSFSSLSHISSSYRYFDRCSADAIIQSIFSTTNSYSISTSSKNSLTLNSILISTIQPSISLNLLVIESYPRSRQKTKRTFLSHLRTVIEEGLFIPTAAVFIQRFSLASSK